MASVLDFEVGTPSYILAKPNGGISTNTNGATTAKIYPMKEHWGKLAVNRATNEIVAQSTFEFFRTGSWCRSVAKGLGKTDGQIDTLCPNQDSPIPSEALAVPVHTYQTLNHGVDVQTNALGANNQCNVCHTGAGNAANPKRMQLSGTGGLGYDLRTDRDLVTCNNSGCHSRESNPGFVELHSKHRSEGVACSNCHRNR
jgi:hypothetical protein